MGYTHYFTKQRNFTDDEWNLVAAAVKKLLGTNGAKKVVTAEVDMPGRPVLVSDNLICFNGRGDDAHETFYLPKMGQVGFNFCKTARKPYDVYVVATLTLIDTYAPTVLSISSDGSVDEWAEGVALASHIVGMPLGCPFVNNAA